MQKLQLKSIYKLFKRCRFCHQEYNKIGFTIFGFFCDFICIVQDTAKTHKRDRNFLRVGPRKDLKVHRNTLGLHKTPQQESRPRNVALGPWGRGGRPKSGDLAGVPGRGRVWEGYVVSQGSVWVLGGGREAPEGRGQRIKAVGAARAVAPARMWPGLSNKQRQDHLHGLGETPEWLDGWEKERAQEFTVRPLMVNRGGSGRRRIARDRRAPALFIAACTLGRKSLTVPGTVGCGMGSGGDGDVRVRGPSTTVTRVGGRRGLRGRVAREEWGRNVGGAPPDPPALAAWRPWGLGVRAGPTTRDHSVGAPVARRLAWRG
jgi:hypothetical protein